MTDFKLDHKITEEDVKKLNEILEGSGWTVGKLFLEGYLLESDIKRAGKLAYYASGDDCINEARALYETKVSLEKKQTLIANDLKEETGTGE